MILCLGAPLIIDGSRTSPSKISWVSCVGSNVRDQVADTIKVSMMS